MKAFRDLDQLRVCTSGYERATDLATGFNEIESSRSTKRNLVLKPRFDVKCGELCHNPHP